MSVHITLHNSQTFVRIVVGGFGIDVLTSKWFPERVTQSSTSHNSLSYLDYLISDRASNTENDVWMGSPTRILANIFFSVYRLVGVGSEFRYWKWHSEEVARSTYLPVVVVVIVWSRTIKINAFPCPCLSNDYPEHFKNPSGNVESTTCCGRLFQSETTRLLKKNFITSSLDRRLKVSDCVLLGRVH